ncbi:MAG: MBL fold metallo-hydrolase [Firmicutes bacterium]|nr:MBL fold metallo-hydrolase [Bacillota bacterium]
MIEITALASGSTGNCYHITDGHTRLLLDCGIQFKRIQRGLNFQLSGISGVLLTHEHGDHSKAVKDMMKAGIDVYASRGTIEALGITGHRIRPVKAKQQFELGTWTILPFDTVHDAAGPLGFLLANQAGDKLLYLTDTAYCRYQFQGLTHILIECNHSLDIIRENVANGSVPVELKNRIIKTHFGLDNVKEFLRVNDLSLVQEIWLIHLSDGNSDAARFKSEIQSLTGKPTYIA